jgi:hypothetical protein
LEFSFLRYLYILVINPLSNVKLERERERERERETGRDRGNMLYSETGGSVRKNTGVSI